MPSTFGNVTVSTSPPARKPRSNHIIHNSVCRATQGHQPHFSQRRQNQREISKDSECHKKVVSGEIDISYSVSNNNDTDMNGLEEEVHCNPSQRASMRSDRKPFYDSTKKGAAADVGQHRSGQPEPDSHATESPEQNFFDEEVGNGCFNSGMKENKGEREPDETGEKQRSDTNHLKTSLSQVPRNVSDQSDRRRSHASNQSDRLPLHPSNLSDRRRSSTTYQSDSRRSYPPDPSDRHSLHPPDPSDRRRLYTPDQSDRRRSYTREQSDRPPLHPPDQSDRRRSYTSDQSDRLLLHPSDLSDRRRSYPTELSDRRRSYPTEQSDRHSLHPPDQSHHRRYYTSDQSDRRRSYPTEQSDRHSLHPPDQSHRRRYYTSDQSDRRRSYPTEQSDRHSLHPPDQSHRRRSYTSDQYDRRRSYTSDQSDRRRSHPSDESRRLLLHPSDQSDRRLWHTSDQKDKRYYTRYPHDVSSFHIYGNLFDLPTTSSIPKVQESGSHRMQEASRRCSTRTPRSPRRCSTASTGLHGSYSGQDIDRSNRSRGRKERYQQPIVQLSRRSNTGRPLPQEESFGNSYLSHRESDDRERSLPSRRFLEVEDIPCTFTGRVRCSKLKRRQSPSLSSLKRSHACNSSTRLRSSSAQSPKLSPKRPSPKINVNIMTPNDGTYAVISTNDNGSWTSPTTLMPSTDTSHQPDKNCETSEPAVTPTSENIPQETANIPQQSVDIPQQSVDIPQQTANIPQQFANIPQQTANIPQQFAYIPQQTANIPQQSVDIPQQTANIPQQSVDIPQQTANIPQQFANIPQQTPNIPQQFANISQRIGHIPQKFSIIPQQFGHIPQASVSFPQPADCIPHPTGRINPLIGNIPSPMSSIIHQHPQYIAGVSPVNFPASFSNPTLHPQFLFAPPNFPASCLSSSPPYSVYQSYPGAAAAAGMVPSALNPSSQRFNMVQSDRLPKQSANTKVDSSSKRLTTEEDSDIGDFSDTDSDVDHLSDTHDNNIKDTKIKISSLSPSSPPSSSSSSSSSCCSFIPCWASIFKCCAPSVPPGNLNPITTPLSTDHYEPLRALKRSHTQGGTGSQGGRFSSRSVDPNSSRRGECADRDEKRSARRRSPSRLISSRKRSSSEAPPAATPSHRSTASPFHTSSASPFHTSSASPFHTSSASPYYMNALLLPNGQITGIPPGSLWDRSAVSAGIPETLRVQPQQQLFHQPQQFQKVHQGGELQRPPQFSCRLQQSQPIPSTQQQVESAQQPQFHFSPQRQALQQSQQPQTVPPQHQLLQMAQPLHLFQPQHHIALQSQSPQIMVASQPKPQKVCFVPWRASHLVQQPLPTHSQKESPQPFQQPSPSPPQPQEGNKHNSPEAVPASSHETIQGDKTGVSIVQPSESHQPAHGVFPTTPRLADEHPRKAVPADRVPPCPSLHPGISPAARPTPTCSPRPSNVSSKAELIVYPRREYEQSESGSCCSLFSQCGCPRLSSSAPHGDRTHLGSMQPAHATADGYSQKLLPENVSSSPTAQYPTQLHQTTAPATTPSPSPCCRCQQFCCCGQNSVPTFPSTLPEQMDNNRTSGEAHLIPLNNLKPYRRTSPTSSLQGKQKFGKGMESFQSGCR